MPIPPNRKNSNGNSSSSNGRVPSLDGVLKSGVGGDLLLSDPHHFRGDCAMIAKLISMGVVSPERAQGLLEKMFRMMEETPSLRAIQSGIKALELLKRLEVSYTELEASKEREEETNRVHVYIPDNSRDSSTQSNQT